MSSVDPKHTVKVFTYPESREQASIAIESINELSNLLSWKCGIDLSITVENGHDRYSTFSEFLKRLHDTCIEYDISPIATVLMHIDCIIREPSAYGGTPLTYWPPPLGGKNAEFLQPFVEESRNRSKQWQPASGIQVHILQCTQLLSEQDGRHGEAEVAKDPKQSRIAILRKTYPEIIYHEFLHLFGVQDGYDRSKPKKPPLPGCESCWMQWEAINGKGLCQKHQDALREFLLKRTL